MNKLTEALRQYRHNNSDDFVFGYDKEIIDQLFAALEQERDQLKAMNANFSEAIETASDAFRRLDEQGAYIIGEKDVFLNLHVLYEKLLDINQSACLATIQAKAIEDFQTYFDKEYYGEELSQFVEKYADTLRQQAKGDI